MLDRFFLVCLVLFVFNVIDESQATICAEGTFSSYEDGCFKPYPDQPVNAFEKPMSFTMRQITFRPEGTWIAAEGIITKDTPSDFRKFLKNNIVFKENRIEFNSPGGNLYAAMELGRIIRERGNSTTLGRTLTLDGPNLPIKEFDNPVCFSACAYAFLGGQERSLFSDNGKLGVHRFGNKSYGVTGDQAQATTSDIAQYIEEMGVDQKLLQIASRTDFLDDIFIIDKQTAKELKVTFDPNDQSSRFEISLLGEHIVANTTIFHQGFQYSARLHCIDGFPRFVVWGPKETLPIIFHNMADAVAQFISKDNEFRVMVDGGVLPNGNAYATFSGLELPKTLMENGQLALDMVWSANFNQMESYERNQWIDMVIWFGFSLTLENAADTVPIVLRECT